MLTHDQAARRFTYDNGVELAVLEYRGRSNRLIIMHTAVPPELESKGVGGLLVRAAVDFAAEHGLTVVPICPFAQSWLRRHGEVAALAAIDWPEHR
jgi:predicted GNAT family acetyltransferase